MKRWIHAARAVEEVKDAVEQFVPSLLEDDDKGQSVRDRVEKLGTVLGKLDYFFDPEVNRRLVGDLDTYISAGWYYRQEVAISDYKFLGMRYKEMSDDEVLHAIEKLITAGLEGLAELESILNIDLLDCKWAISNFYYIYIRVPGYTGLAALKVNGGEVIGMIMPKLALELIDAGLIDEANELISDNDAVKNALKRRNRISNSQYFINSLPADVVSGLVELNHWIAKEKLDQHASSLNEARQLLIDRTYSNRRSSWYNESKVLFHIDNVLDYAKSRAWSLSDLKKYSNTVVKYMRDLQDLH